MSSNPNPSQQPWQALASVGPLLISIVGGLVTSLMIVKDVEAQSAMSAHRVTAAEARVDRLESKIDSLMMITRENQVSLTELKKDVAEIREEIRGRSD